MNRRVHSADVRVTQLAARAILIAAAFAVLPRASEAQHGGIWEPPFQWPMVPVHMLHHTNGDVLTWAYDGFSATLWHTGPSSTLPTPEFTPVPNPLANHFCAGHAGMADGLYMVAGGFFVDSALVFDNVSSDPGVWTARQDLNFTRFYPTCTTLPDGRILTVSGYGDFGDVETPEVYDPESDKWTTLDGARKQLPLYPLMFLLPDGRVFFAGPGTDTHVLDVGSESWAFVGTSSVEGGSAVMYLPGRVMKCGGLFSAEKGTEVIDFTQSIVPTWRTVGSMNFPRATHNLTILPDGSVLATGGWDDTGQPVLAAELFDPRAETWTLLASMQEPRLYHSTALLLRDGRVVAGGGDGYPSAEIFRPPYLFAGPRPGIVWAPDRIEYQEEFTIKVTDDTTSVKSVALVRLGAVTHSFDQNQRYVPLKFDPRLHVDPPTVHVAAPRNGRIAPPGAYMLFIVSGAGVPSLGHYIYLH